MPSITISISAEKYTKWKTGFLKIYPTPEGGNEGDHIRGEVIRWAQRAYERGHNMIEKEAQEVPEAGLVT